MKPDKPDAIDLFAGAGGWSLAARAFGLVSTGVEWDPAACATRRAAGLSTLSGDVRAYGPGSTDFPQIVSPWPGLPSVRRLFGSPPCQTFSIAGNGTGRRALDDVLKTMRRLAAGQSLDYRAFTDERTGLVLEPLRWVLGALRMSRPFETVALEQVPPVLPVWEAMAEVLRAEGYAVATGILRAEEFGAPQTRRRAVLMARFDTDRIALPKPTHRRYPSSTARTKEDARLREWVSMGRALGWTTPRVVISNYGTGGDPAARGRRRWDEPAATVTSKFGRNRVVGDDGTELPRLTFREAGVLQTFPADFPWSGSAGEIAEQVGNAIPPMMARAIVAALLGLRFDEPGLPG